MYRSPDKHFEGGAEVDPQTEASLERWAFSQPVDDDPCVVAEFSGSAPLCDPEPYDMRREREEKRDREAELREEAWR